MVSEANALPTEPQPLPTFIITVSPLEILQVPSVQNEAENYPEFWKTSIQGCSNETFFLFVVELESQ